MRFVCAIALIALFAPPAMAVVVHDESVHGDLSTDPLNPTPIVFASQSSTILGTVSNVAGVDRDFITFTIDSDRVLSGLRLIAFSPNNLAFAALNAGATSFVPSASTNASFLAGIHPTGTDVGGDLMPHFVSRSVTTNALPEPFLGPGTYCFLIQQTSPILQSYTLEFIVDFVLPAHADSWGAIKALYRSSP